MRRDQLFSGVWHVGELCCCLLWYGCFNPARADRLICLASGGLCFCCTSPRDIELESETCRCYQPQHLSQDSQGDSRQQNETGSLIDLATAATDSPLATNIAEQVKRASETTCPGLTLPIETRPHMSLSIRNLRSFPVRQVSDDLP